MSGKIPESITVPGAAITDLIRLGDGDTALLFLYLTAAGNEKTSGEVADTLRWSRERTRSAFDKLISNALMPAPPPAKAEPAREPEETPEKRARVPGVSESSKPFYSLVQEVERIFGRVLSSDELGRLFSVYDSLGLPPEVILQLIGYCNAETGGRDGTDRAPSMRYIEKAAYTWEREGIFTLESAERYIKQRAALRSEAARVKKTLSIQDRDFSATEKKYVDSWLALGFNAEAVAIAYDRTVTKTGRLAWNYMNSIINSWHSKGLYTAADILEKDTRSERSFSSGRAEPREAQPDENELRRINRILESMGEEIK